MIKQRNIGLSILFSILSCGIYFIYWQYKMTKEITTYNGEDANPTVEVLLSYITCSIYFFYWNYKMGKRIARACPSSDDSLLYVILSIFGLGIVSIAIMQSHMNSIAES